MTITNGQAAQVLERAARGMSAQRIAREVLPGVDGATALVDQLTRGVSAAQLAARRGELLALDADAPHHSTPATTPAARLRKIVAALEELAADNPALTGAADCARESLTRLEQAEAQAELRARREQLRAELAALDSQLGHTCPICGWSSKTRQGLAHHRTRKHADQA